MSSLHDGLVVVKQPDVFSQARLTRFRNDVDQQISSDLVNFHLVLAARINRLDAATTTSTTAWRGPRRAGHDQCPAAGRQCRADPGQHEQHLFPSTGPSLFGSSAISSQGAFGNLVPAPNTFNLPAGSAAATAALGLGVDPTVYLDEKNRFLMHLNQIRRINMGPDQNDSSGYGLYLVRTAGLDHTRRVHATRVMAPTSP